MGKRPLAAHRLLIEVDLVTVDDLGHETLVNSLTQLALAGLHGMVSSLVRVCLDGVDETPDMTISPSAGAVRPPPDPRVDVVRRDLEKAVALLRSIDRIAEPVPLAAS